MLPRAPVVPSNRRVRTGGGLLVSLLIHAGIVAIAWFIVVRAAERDPELAEGEEGVRGDDSPPVFVHRAPKPKIQPKETVPEVIPETPRRLVSTSPSAIVLQPTAPPVPAVIPAVAVASEKMGSVSPVTAKSSGHHRPGSKGAGEKGRGRLSNGNGSGTVAPTNPRLLTQIAPDFPASARRRGAHGVAWVRVQVSAGGSVAAASLHRSSGSEDLDAAAVRTAKRWHFAPATAGGHPVSAAAVVKVVFAASR